MAVFVDDLWAGRYQGICDVCGWMSPSCGDEDVARRFALAHRDDCHVNRRAERSALGGRAAAS